MPETIALTIKPSNTDLDFWRQLFASHHDIWQDHDALTQLKQINDQEFGAYFDNLGRVYPDRFEYKRYRLLATTNKKAAAIARELLFKIL